MSIIEQVNSFRYFLKTTFKWHKLLVFFNVPISYSLNSYNHLFSNFTMRHKQASIVIFTNLLIENTENIGKPDRQKQMNTIRSPWLYNSSN